MDPPQVTVRELFEVRLPELHTPPHPDDLVKIKKAPERLENKVKEKGKPTKPLLPSPAMLRQDLFWLQSTWTIHRAFLDTNTSPALRSLVTPLCAREIRCEGDVVDIVASIVLPAIDHALNHSCSELVKLQLLPPGTTIARTTERRLTKECRPDVVWEIVYQKDLPGTRQILAIMDYKCPFAIFEDEFEPALAKSIEDLRGMLVRASGAPEGTLLINTAANLSKKAVKYSELCPLVAIFDYHKLALFEFPVRKAMDGSVQSPYHLLAAEQEAIARLGGVAYKELVSCLIFDEKTAPDDMTFRKVLYSFVVQRLQDAFV